MYVNKPADGFTPIYIIHKPMKVVNRTIYMILLISLACGPVSENNAMPSSPDRELEDGPYIQLSQELVRAVKNDTDRSGIIERLANIPMQQLAEALDTDAEKKAFFINVYNGFVQHILMKNPEKFDDRDKFFTTDQINIAGQELSLDDIEHGIIRGSKVKWSLGLIQDPFADDFEKNFRVEETDPRIHFALNCGAKSCPYVAIYGAEKLDQQLDIISRQFLERTTEYKADEDKVYVTTLISWFRGDFGGLDGAKEMLKNYDIIPKSADPELEFKDYDWTLELGNFTTLDT